MSENKGLDSLGEALFAIARIGAEVSQAGSDVGSAATFNKMRVNCRYYRASENSELRRDGCIYGGVLNTCTYSCCKSLK